MPTLVTLTGPIAAGKNTVADLLAARWTQQGLTVVVADVDDVAAMVAAPGAAAAGLWSAAHEVHGVLVAQWLRSGVDVVVSVGPVYTPAEQDALLGPLPPGVRLWRVLIDAPLAVTWDRVRSDPDRGLSRDRDFHVAAHARYRSLMPGIPADVVVDSATTSADAIAAEVVLSVGHTVRQGGEPGSRR